MTGFNRINPIINKYYDCIVQSLKPEEAYSFYLKSQSTEIHKHKLVKREHRCSPFAWEILTDKKEQLDEQSLSIVNRLKEINRCNLIVSAGNKFFETRCDREFKLFLENHLNDQPTNKALIIGSDKDSIAKCEVLRKHSDKIIVISSVNMIFSFFKAIAKMPNIAAMYTYPKSSSGSGRTNTYAILAGLPTVLFKLNDASSHICTKELVDSYEQLEEKKFKIFNNQDFRSMLSIKQKFFAQAINDKADHFWREILLPPQST